MKVLLDTCIVSEMIKNKPDLSVINWIRDQHETNLLLSVITVGELRKGIVKLQKSKKKEQLEKWFATELLPRFKGRIVPISEAVMFEWGKLIGELELNGRCLPIMDGLIAATVITENLTLATRNINDFNGLDISIINPYSLV